MIQKRSYKNFSTESFLTDILHSNINNSVTSHDTIEGAAEAFRNEFSAILNYNAPIKTFQARNNYCPYISADTKAMMVDRKALKEDIFI